MSKKSIFYAFTFTGLMFLIGSPLKAASESESLEKEFASNPSSGMEISLYKG